MKASELRIGNLVKGFNAIGELKFTVHSIDEERIAIGGWSDLSDGGKGRGHMNLKGVYGIELTKEWLLKFGFKKEIYLRQNYFVLDEIFIDEKIDENGYSIYIGTWDSVEQNYYACQYKYVHQLQNLFFYLTGEELELKELAK